MIAFETVEHRLDVPLDHTGVSPGTITVFAREVFATETADQQLP